MFCKDQLTRNSAGHEPANTQESEGSSGIRDRVLDRCVLMASASLLAVAMVAAPLAVDPATGMPSVFDSTLADGDRELAIITAAREADCAYEWGAHVRLAREVGVRSEAIDAVGSLGATDALTPDEALIVNYGRELLAAHHVSDVTFNAARERLGEQGVIELTALLGYYTMVACTLNATAVEPLDTMEALPDRR